MATHSTSLDPIEKLATLAACRTTRTDRLEAAVHTLLAKLEPHVEVGFAVDLDRHVRLQRVRIKSNIGYTDFWQFTYRGERDEFTCMLDETVGGERYLHGDFHCKLKGPSRGDLIAFATHAPELVAAIIARQERENDMCEHAIGAVELAAPEEVSR
jgi:hypothetical protein